MSRSRGTHKKNEELREQVERDRLLHKPRAMNRLRDVRAPPLTVAAQTFLGLRGGIARVSQLTARVALEAGYPTSLLSVQDEAGNFEGSEDWQGCGGSRVKFLAGCWKAGLAGNRIFYDQLGSARAHIRPGNLARSCGVWIHGIEVWEQLRADRLRAAHRMSCMIANSHFTRERAIGRHGVFESARVCWLGTSEDDLPEEAAPLDGPPNVLILGRLDAADVAYKGHKELIEIWPSVVAGVPGARLVIVGTGPSLEWHRGLAASSQAAALIDVVGLEAESALAERWRRAIVFAMPSRGEGFGLAYIEAMRWGVPVIASTHDAGSEVNIHGETGLNVNLTRPHELRDALVELLRDRDLARRMGLAGQRRWREHFCYSAFSSRFAEELLCFAKL
jgi:phosphatidylinositol alpha-1,6-mannosyltransferase